VHFRPVVSPSALEHCSLYSLNSSQGNRAICHVVLHRKATIPIGPMYNEWCAGADPEVCPGSTTLCASLWPRDGIVWKGGDCSGGYAVTEHVGRLDVGGGFRCRDREPLTTAPPTLGSASN
jgi:hypothetical protein